MLVVASKLSIICTILAIVGTAVLIGLITLLGIGFLWYKFKGTCMTIGNCKLSINNINWVAVGFLLSFTVSLDIWAIILAALKY